MCVPCMDQWPQGSQIATGGLTSPKACVLRNQVVAELPSMASSGVI